MNKKSILLMLTAGCTGLGVAAITLSNTSTFALRAGGPALSHEIAFTTADVTSDTPYDEETCTQYFTIYHSEAIADGDGVKWDVQSNSTYTYVYSIENATFGGSSFVSFTSPSYWSLSVGFNLIYRAELDEEKSFFTYSVDGVYKGNSKFELTELEEDYAIYCATLNIYDIGYNVAYNHTVSIDLMKLEFACSQ